VLDAVETPAGVPPAVANLERKPTIVGPHHLEKLSLWTGEVKGGSLAAVSANTLPTLSP